MRGQKANSSSELRWIAGDKAVLGWKDIQLFQFPFPKNNMSLTPAFAKLPLFFARKAPWRKGLVGGGNETTDVVLGDASIWRI